MRICFLRWDSNSSKNCSLVMFDGSFSLMASEATFMPAFSSRRVPIVSNPITLKLERLVGEAAIVTNYEHRDRKDMKEVIQMGGSSVLSGTGRRRTRTKSWGPHNYDTGKGVFLTLAASDWPMGSAPHVGSIRFINLSGILVSFIRRANSSGRAAQSGRPV